MAVAKLYNLARMTTPTNGTGTITLGAAVSSFLTFTQAGVSDGETITYAIEDLGNSAREIGRGVYTAAGPTLTRSVLKSTNSDAAINLSGSAQVFITAAKEDFPVAAAGTQNYLPKWDANSALTQTSNVYDDGTNVLLGGNPAVTSLGGATPTVQALATSATNVFLVARYANDNAAVGIIFQKSRGATIGAQGAVQNGDVYAAFSFGGSDGTGIIRGAAIRALVNGTVSTGHVPTDLLLMTSAANSFIEQLRIGSDGTLTHRQNNTIVVDASSLLGLRSYTVGTLPSASTAARLIYVSDGTTNKRLAVSDGTNWRFPDGNVVS
jgi:hypothetical protein